MRALVHRIITTAGAAAVLGVLSVPAVAVAGRPTQERPREARVERRAERPRQERDGKRVERPREVRVERRGDRGHHDGGDRRHVRVEPHRHYRRPVVVHDRGWYPPVWRRVVTHHPWYAGTRVVYVDRDPFYFHAGFGIYLGGLALQFEIGDMAPEGFGFYDPYCGEIFFTMDNYHRHLRGHRHEAALTIIRLDGCRYEDGW